MEDQINIVNKYTHVPTDKDVYIGRRSPLGNIYSHMHGTLAQYRVVNREEAVEKYGAYLRNKIEQKDAVIIKELNRIYNLAKNGQVNLVCYCSPRKCHGEVIKKIVLEKAMEVNKEKSELSGQLNKYEQVDVYHGTLGSFDEFSSEYLGSNTGANSAKEGFFFATNKEVAKSYASTTNRTLAHTMDELSELDKQVEQLTGHDRITASFKLFRQRRSYEQNYDSDTVKKLEAILGKICDCEDRMNTITDTYLNDSIELHEAAVVKVAVLKMEKPFYVDANFKRTLDIGITKIILTAKENGHDGVVIRNTFDGVGPVGNIEETDVHIVFSKDQIISRGEIKASVPKVIVGVNDEKFGNEPSGNENELSCLTLN